MLVLDNQKNKKRDLIYLFLALMLLSLQNYFLMPSMVTNAAKIAFPSIVFVLCLKKHDMKIINSVFVLWMLIFFLIAFCSMLYASYIDQSIDFLLSIFSSFIMLLAISQYAETEQDIETVINILILGGIIYSLYIFIRQHQTIFISSIDPVYSNGTIMQFTYVMLPTCYYLIWRLFYRKDKRLLTLLMTLFAYMMNILSGRKKALILPLVFLLCVVMIKNRKNFLKILISVALVAILSSIVIYFIMTNELLYALVGRRLEGFMAYFIGNTRVDGSTVARTTLISLAWDAFLEHPVFGMGLGNFSMTNDMGYYAHNNYLEIMAGVGLIGLASYYWIYVYTMPKLLRVLKGNDDSGMAGLFLALLIINLIEDVGTVTYYRPYFNIFLCLGAAFAMIKAGPGRTGLISGKGRSCLKRAAD